MLKNINKTFKLLSFLAITAGLSACTPGDLGPARVPFCKANDPLLTMNQGKGQTKTEVKADSKLAIAAGEYIAQKSSIYVHDYNLNEEFQIAHKVDENGKDVFEPECTGKFSADPKPLTDTIEIISGMKVAADGTAIVSKKRITFTVDPKLPTGIEYSAEDIKDVTVAIADLYEGFAVVEQAVFDSKAGNIQARAKISEGPSQEGQPKTGIERWTNTSLKFVDPTKAQAPK